MVIRIQIDRELEFMPTEIMTHYDNYEFNLID